MIDKFTQGVIYPIPPAFDKDGKLDHLAIIKYVEYLEDHGAKTILTTAGTTRFNMLSAEEIVGLTNSVAVFGGSKIAGIPPLPDMMLDTFIGYLNKSSIDAALLFYPDRYYEDDSIVGYFHRIADQLEIPAMFHGIPMRHAAGGTYEYTPDMVKKIKQHPNIIGMKEESFNLALAYEISRQADNDFLVFPAGGSCRRFLLTYPAGAQTFLGGIGNIFPEIEEEFFKEFKSGNVDRAYKIIETYEDPLFKVFKPIGWHKALQAALNYKGLLPTTNRKPFSEISEDQLKVVEFIIDHIESLIPELNNL